MKTVRVLIALLFLVLAAAQIHSTHAAESIRLANGEWPPYFSDRIRYGGLASRIIKEAFALEGIKVVYIFYPWERNMIYAREGRVDGAVGWNWSEEREKIFFYSDVVIHGSHSFFHLKSFPLDWNTLDDLTDIIIGGCLGYNYGDEFQAAEKSGKIIVERTAMDMQNLNKLLQRQIDVFVVNPDVGFYLIQQHFKPDERQQFVCHPKALRVTTNHVIFPRKAEKSKRLLDLFNKGLKRLKESGKYDQYFAESRRGEYTNIRPE